MPEPRTRAVQITDARDIDGDPYQVADQAFRNLDQILLAADEALDAIDVLATNAEMQRNLDLGNEADASTALDGLICRRLIGMRGDLAAARQSLEVLRRAATFDPNQDD